MPTEIDEKSTERIDLEYCVSVVGRRYIHFLIPLFLGWLAVWAVSWVLPPRYKSATLILVEQPTMPKDYVTPNVSDDFQQRLQSITQQILSRTRLLQIIQDKRLYGDSRTRLTADEQVELMRKDIEIELVRDPQNRVNAFNVYYTARDPKAAQQVTSQLTDFFINENLEVRQKQSEDTTKFLESQLQEARESLAVQESKIREFKGQHLGELPTQVQSNLQILSGLQSQLRTEEDALNAAKQQRAYLQSLIEHYRTSKGDVVNDAPPATIDRELERLKSQLAELTVRYTERHPEVRKLKEQVAKTERQRDQLRAEAASDATLVANGAGRSPALVQLQSQMEANGMEIGSRERSVASIKIKINEYQSRLELEPVREQQFADLTRGYDQSKANYDELLKKKNASAMATSMELLQQGERFRVLDPPSLPTKPSFPNRLKFCGAGLALGLALGVLIAGWFEYTDDRLYREKEIKKLLPAPVICEIPAIPLAEEVVGRQRRNWLGWAFAAVVLGLIVSGSALSYLRG